MRQKPGWLGMIGHLLLCYAFMFLTLLLASILTIVLLGVSLSEIQTVVRNPPAALVLTVTLSWAALATGVTLALTRWLDKRPWSSLGLAPIRQMGLTMALGVFLGALAPLVKLFLLWGTGGFAVEGIQTRTVDWWQYAVLVLVVVPSAWREELIFRGYTLANLTDRLQPAWAVPISALLFALFHTGSGDATEAGMPGVSGIGFFLGGVLLALAFLYERNLWLPLWVHAGFNGFSSLLFSQRLGIVAGNQHATALAADLAEVVGILSAVVLLVFLIAQRTRTAGRGNGPRGLDV